MYYMIFIIIRHVTKEMENCNEVWQECYKSIRRFYSNKIVIIDNNSDKTILNTNIMLENCEIVDNENYETRIFAPFLFLLNYDFDRAIILHDGCIIQKFVDFSQFVNCKYIWHFDTKLYDDSFLIERQLSLLENNQPLINMFREKKFTGCMGGCLGIEKQFLINMEKKHKISNLKNIITNQKENIAFERTLSVLCASLYDDITNDLSFEGEIKNMVWGYIYKHFASKQKLFKVTYDGHEKEIDITEKSIIKIFGARK